MMETMVYVVAFSAGGFISFGFLGLFFGAVVLVIAYDLLIAWIDDIAAEARLKFSMDSVGKQISGYYDEVMTDAE